MLYLVVNAQFRGAVAELCRCPGLLGPCCRKPLTAATTELMELGCPPTVATAAATGAEIGTGCSASPHEAHTVHDHVHLGQRQDQVLSSLLVIANRRCRTVAVGNLESGRFDHAIKAEQVDSG